MPTGRDANTDSGGIYIAGGERRTIAIEGQLDGGDVSPGSSATQHEIFEC